MIGPDETVDVHNGAAPGGEGPFQGLDSGLAFVPQGEATADILPAETARFQESRPVGAFALAIGADAGLQGGMGFLAELGLLLGSLLGGLLSLLGNVGLGGGLRFSSEEWVFSRTWQCQSVNG